MTEVSWQPPAPVSSIGREEARRLGRSMLVIYLAAMGLLAVPALALIAAHAPDQMLRAAAFFVAIGVIYPAILAIQVRASLRRQARYALDDQGLRFGPGEDRVHPWKQVQAYRLADHPTFPGVRSLEFRLRGTRSWQSWSFDPLAVEESAIRESLTHYLPGLEA